MSPSILIWVWIAGLVATTVFSTLSYALRTMSRVELEKGLAKNGRAAALDDILGQRHELALSSAILRLLANVLVVVSMILYFVARWGPRDGQWLEDLVRVFCYALLVAIPAMLLTSIAIPLAWARYAGESLIAATWPMLHLFHRLLYPLVAAMKLCDELVRRLAGVVPSGGPEDEAQQVENEILSVISEGTAEGTVDEEQKKMMEGVISFRDLEVGDIMTPRTDITALDVATATLADIREKVIKDGLSRIPIYENSLDNIIGILYAKDLLGLLNDPRLPPLAGIDASGAPPAAGIDMRRLMRPPLFVPRTKPLRDLLREFRFGHVHMAIVLDEYGGTSGLVTSEDIIEQIVGDIADEYEKPVLPELKRIDARTVEVDARMNITDLNRALDLSLPIDQDYQTIGGFVISTLGAIPAKGDRLTHDGLTITVLDSEPRRVKLLRLELPAADQPAEAPLEESGAAPGI